MSLEEFLSGKRCDFSCIRESIGWYLLLKSEFHSALNLLLMKCHKFVDWDSMTIMCEGSLLVEIRETVCIFFFFSESIALNRSFNLHDWNWISEGKVIVAWHQWHGLNTLTFDNVSLLILLLFRTRTFFLVIVSSGLCIPWYFNDSYLKLLQQLRVS